MENIEEFYRPLKQQISIKLDKDIIAYFKKEAERIETETGIKTGYQTLINDELRKYMIDNK